jgi:hypothetical protein
VSLQEGWNNHLSLVTTKRVAPIGKKVIKRTVSAGCDAKAAVLGDGHITIRNDVAVYHFPISSVDIWKSSATTNCSVPVPEEKKEKKEKKKRKKQEASDSPDETASKKQATASSSVEPIHPQPDAFTSSSNKRGVEEPESEYEPPPKRVDDGPSGLCGCSGCCSRDKEYVLLFNHP